MMSEKKQGRETCIGRLDILNFTPIISCGSSFRLKRQEGIRSLILSVITRSLLKGILGQPFKSHAQSG